jgi:hypothetical protein
MIKLLLTILLNVLLLLPVVGWGGGVAMYNTVTESGVVAAADIYVQAEKNDSPVYEEFYDTWDQFVLAVGVLDLAANAPQIVRSIAKISAIPRSFQELRAVVNNLPTNAPKSILRAWDEVLEVRIGKYSTSIDNLVTEIPKAYLPQSVVETFTDGFYRTVTTNHEITLYRGFGSPNAYLKGSYSTTIQNATRNELAILDEWGNSLRFEAKIEVPTGQTLNIGKVEKQISSDGLQNLSGGADQVLLPQNWDCQNWVKAIVDKQTSITYTYSEFLEVFPNLISP